MAFIQDTIPPPNKIEQFSLKDFTGGLNNNSELLEINEATDLLNMAFTNDTVMEKRYGITYLNDEVYDGKITFMDVFRTYRDGDKQIVCTNSGIYVDGELLSEVEGQVRGVTHSGKYYFVDGDSFYVYGSTFPTEENDYVSIIKPEPEPEEEPKEDDEEETEVEEEYFLFKIVSSPEEYTPLSKEHQRGKDVYNYETGEVHYEPCLHELEDPYKNANVVPSSPTYIVSFDDRLYLSGDKDDDDNVFISDVQNSYYFPASLPLQPTPDSDKVRGLIVYDSGVLIGRGGDMYIVHGKTNNPELGHDMFKLHKINTHTGIASDSSMCVVHNHLFFLGSDGVAYALGTTRMDERFLHTQIISRQLDLFKAPFNFTYKDLESATSVFHAEEWYVSIKDKVLVYNYRLRAWTLYESHDATYLIRLNNAVVWGNSEGRLSTYGEGFLDYGVPFKCVWSSRWFDMDNANAHKQFREFFIVAHTFEEINSDVRVKFEVDYVDVEEEELIDNQMSIWGVSVFGDRFITRNINASLPFVLGRRGRQIRFTLRNGYTPEAPVESVYDLEYVEKVYYGYLTYVNEEEAYYLYTHNGWVKQSLGVDLDQRMRVYQINGEYEFRGKR